MSNDTTEERLAVMEERQRANSAVLLEMQVNIHGLQRLQWLSLGAFLACEFLMKFYK